MASILKNQIVKHLSKFTKNLAPEKINLSTLKGEGELTDLELNELVLMELMDLPTWLSLTKAVCNKVSIKMQWSKLKTQPIRVYLDEVRVSMEMNEVLRQHTNASGLPSYSSGGRYGFGDRVVDGMFVQINAVIVEFTSKAFRAQLSISRIIVESKTPTWRQAADLGLTRISDKRRDLLLTFKEIDWQTLRIEADCMVGEGKTNTATTPLRLITNQSKIRIAVKKRYSDCSVVATKVQFILDDLLWILTDSQMKAAVVFAHHIKDKIQKAAEQSKAIAAHTIQKQKQAQRAPASASATNTSPSTVLFAKFDILETSYHIHTSRVDLHICDDINVHGRARMVDGGAIGIAVMKLTISHFPMRSVGESRTKWQGYDDNMASRDQWTAELLRCYTQHLDQEANSGKIKLTGMNAEHIAHSLVERLTMVKLEDFFVTTVSSEKDHGERPKKLILSDKKSLFLPTEMSAIYVEHTDYFFPHNSSLPMPCSNLYVQVNPIKLFLDTYTISWMNSFSLSLSKDVEDLIEALPIDRKSSKERVDIRVEMLMPKVILMSNEPTPLYQHDRPHGVQAIISRLVLTNSHMVLASSHYSKDAHKRLLDSCKLLTLCQKVADFPSDKRDIALITKGHELYSCDNRLMYTRYENGVSSDNLRRSDLCQEVISVDLEQFWMEFIGVKNAGPRPVSFIESFPITVWLAIPQAPDASVSSVLPDRKHFHKPLRRVSEAALKIDTGDTEESSSLGLMIEIGGKVCAQLNHYQFCFLMRLADSFSSMMQTIKMEQTTFWTATTTKRTKQLNLVSVVLHVKEVQFAMLAAPNLSGHSHMNTDTSDPELSTPVGSVPNDCSELEGTDTSLEAKSNDAIEDFSSENVLAQNPSETNDVEVTTDADSYIILTSSDTNDPDLVLERSVFYHSASPSEAGSVSSSRSSFYTPNTALPGDDSIGGRSKLSSAFSKVTSKVKQSVSKVVASEDSSDSWETLSLTSSFSDDGDALAEIALQSEEVAFTPQNGGDFHQDEQESEDNRSERPKQMVSVTLFKICDIEVGTQVVDNDIVAKICVGSLANQELGNMYYDAFQAQQLAAVHVHEKEPIMTEKKPVRVRFSMGPAAASLAYGAAVKGFAQIQVADYSLSFLTSTLTKLSPLFKDEKSGVPVPLMIDVMNFDLCLQDDSAPIYSTPCPALPIKMRISKVSLIRTIDGVFTVQGETIPETNAALQKPKNILVDSSTMTSNSDNTSSVPAVVASSSSQQLLQEMQYLQDENKALKEQILRLNHKLIEKDQEMFHQSESTSDNDSQTQLSRDLQFYKMETVKWKNQVLNSNEEVEALHRTKECLTQTILILKEELLKAETSFNNHVSVG